MDKKAQSSLSIWLTIQPTRVTIHKTPWSFIIITKMGTRSGWLDRNLKSLPPETKQTLLYVVRKYGSFLPGKPSSPFLPGGPGSPGGPFSGIDWAGSPLGPGSTRKTGRGKLLIFHNKTQTEWDHPPIFCILDWSSDVFLLVGWICTSSSNIACRRRRGWARRWG